MSDRRGPWYLLTGLVLGLVIGLLYAWAISPVLYVDTSPAFLRTGFKDQYRALIAVAYQANGDLARARVRLGLLQDADVYRTLAIQAQQMLAEGGSSDEARALGLLADALAQEINATSSLASAGTSASVASPSPAITASLSASTATPGVTQTATPIPTRTPLPTLTPTPPSGVPFTLEDQSQVCDPLAPEPLIQVLLFDANGQPVPGVAVTVSWPGHEERFFTGLKPEMGLGYADFVMTPGISYDVRVADGAQAEEGLSPEECESPSGERYWGSWSLTFAQPSQ